MELILGPPNSGKSERVLSQLARAMERAEGRILLIVPSTGAATVATARLQSVVSNPAKAIQVVKTFPGLYTDIFTETGKNVFVLRRVERDRLLRRAINELADENRLSYFAAIARRPGLVQSIGSLIEELWRSLTDPKSFEQIAAQRTDKDRDIALIFSRYAGRLVAARAADSEGAGLQAIRALESIRESPGNRKINFSFVAADGFDFYTPVQVKLLSLLSSLGVETVATLTYEEGRAVHIWQRATRARFHAADAQIVELRNEPSGEIERIAARFLADERDRAQTDSSPPITVISAPDRAAEAQAAAREIKRLIIEEGFSTYDITIICRSLAGYSNHLERVFRQCSIPLVVDTPLALHSAPAVIAILRLLSLSIDSFPRRRVMACLRSPLFDLAPLGLGEEAINLIDHASVAGNVTRGREQWIESLARAAEKRDDRENIFDIDREEVDSRCASAAESLSRFFDEVTLPALATHRAFAQKVLRLIEAFGLEGCIQRVDDCARDLAALGVFRALIEGIEKDADDAERVIERAEFFEEIERASSSISFERPETGEIAILAQEAHNLRPRLYSAVFVLGLIEGEFPARAVERFPYTLSEREELRCQGMDLAETPADAGADVTQFYKAMASATRRLYLSYARADGGSELLRSYLIDEVLSCAPAREVRIAQQTLSFDSLPMSHIISLEELALVAAREMREGAESAQLGVARSVLEENLRSWRASIRAAEVERGRITGDGPARLNGVIEDARLQSVLSRRLGEGHLWSASQINDYGTCPFRFFARHVLKLARKDEPMEGFVPARLGTAYHKILERAHIRMNESGLQLSLDRIEDLAALAEQVADETLEEMTRAGEIRKGVFWEFEKAEIKRNVIKLLAKEAQWKSEREQSPVAFEQKFGLDGNPPLVIDSSGGEVRICGVIDRIDAGEDGAVIIDYKTTRTPIRHADAVEGRNLQLPIYMMAAAELRPQTRVAAAFYLHITSRKKGSEIPHGEDSHLSVEGIIAHAEEKIRQYTAGARAGRFPVLPNNNRCYQGCEYQALCRISEI